MLPSWNSFLEKWKTGLAWIFLLSNSRFFFCLFELFNWTLEESSGCFMNSQCTTNALCLLYSLLWWRKGPLIRAFSWKLCDGGANCFFSCWSLGRGFCALAVHQGLPYCSSRLRSGSHSVLFWRFHWNIATPAWQCPILGSLFWPTAGTGELWQKLANTCRAKILALPSDFQGLIPLFFLCQNTAFWHLLSRLILFLPPRGPYHSPGHLSRSVGPAPWPALAFAARLQPSEDSAQHLNVF